MPGDQTFLTSEWRHLAFLNYEVDPRLLSEFVPAGTELDQWNGKCFVSLVGFRFLKTRVWGVPIPFHRNFTEVNLRFYVRRRERNEIRRGVVFIKDVVPRAAIAAVARNLYNERYICLPMNYEIQNGESSQSVGYGWRSGTCWNRINVKAQGNPDLPAQHSEEQFITEHYWGFTKQKDGTTIEYRVSHSPWRVWRGHEASFSGDVSDLYGRELASVLTGPPSSAFIAEGSAVTVSRGRRICREST